jgi:hypothetical protein
MVRQHAAQPLWRSLGLLLLAGWVLAGCAIRPGPEVLNPVPSSVPGARIVTVYVATTRAREIPSSNVFSNNRAPELNYAEFRISVPPGHQPGQIEWPALMLDPATSFTTVQQTVLDRSSFEQKITGRLPRLGLLAFARETGTTVYHPASTCRMGSDPAQLLMNACAYVGSTNCARSTPRSYQLSSPATPTPRR